MISVSKYNEIMEHIELTEEMRERIIGNIEKEQRRKRIKMVTGICTAAAACIVAIVGLTVVNGREDLPQQPDTATTTTVNTVTTGTSAPVVSEPEAVSSDVESEPDEVIYYAPEEFADAEELSQAFGIEMQDVEMPFEVSETTYTLYFGEFAEICYTGSDGEMCWIRKGKTEEDISGDYNEYDTETEKELNGLRLTLKGNEEKYSLCSWVQDGHFCCIGFENGISEDDMLDMAKNAIEE